MAAKHTRIWTYEEALDSFPMVRSLTTTAVRQVEALFNQVQSREEMESRRTEIEEAYRTLVEAWTAKILALGCEVKGLWLVDWDNGDGYYCWRYPEETLGHFHTYEEGFADRIPIN